MLSGRKTNRQLCTGICRPSGSCHSAQQLLASSLSFYLRMHICTLSKSQVSEAVHVANFRSYMTSFALIPLSHQRARSS